MFAHLLHNFQLNKSTELGHGFGKVHKGQQQRDWDQFIQVPTEKVHSKTLQAPLLRGGEISVEKHFIIYKNI